MYAYTRVITEVKDGNPPITFSQALFNFQNRSSTLNSPHEIFMKTKKLFPKDFNFLQPWIFQVPLCAHQRRRLQHTTTRVWEADQPPLSPQEMSSPANKSLFLLMKIRLKNEDDADSEIDVFLQETS